MSVFHTTSAQSFTLASSISSTQTSITLSSFKVPVSGTDITMSSMNTSIAYGTLAPGTTSAELISFTGVTQNADGTATLTGVTRGLNKEYPYTESSSFKEPHAGQTVFILSDAPQVWNEFPAKRNDESITGQFTFPQSGTASAARAGAVYAAPTADTEFATRKFVVDTASFGAPIATQTTAGIVILPRATQLEAGTLYSDATTASVGLVVMNAQYGARKILGYNVTGGSANAYTLDVGTSAPTTYATGAIVGFQASFANTGNATINVNSLGAKNLFLGGTGLFAGAIATNAYVGAVYDGTRFVVVDGSSLLATDATANTVPVRRSTGDITVPTTPTNSTDATSKSYVDSLGTGFVASSAPGTTTTNTTANVATIAVAGGTLSTNKGVKVTVMVQSAMTATNNGATYTISYGGTTIGTVGYAGVTGTPTVTAVSYIDILLQGAGTTGTQRASAMTNSAITSGSGGGATGSAAQTSSLSIDSTTDKNILISCTAGASSTGTLLSYFVEKIV